MIIRENIVLIDCEGAIFNTANASKHIEKYFLDLRKEFLNQENIRKFFLKQEDLSSKENSSRPVNKKVYLNLRKWSQNKNNFLETRNIFSLKNAEVTTLNYWSMQFILKEVVK